jgi:hypothetical protein
MRYQSPQVIWAMMFMPFGLPDPNDRYSAFQSFDYECTRCRSFQKHVMPTKLDVSVFIVITGLIPLLVD